MKKNLNHKTSFSTAISLLNSQRNINFNSKLLFSMHGAHFFNLRRKCTKMNTYSRKLNIRYPLQEAIKKHIKMIAFMVLFWKFLKVSSPEIACCQSKGSTGNETESRSFRLLMPLTLYWLLTVLGKRTFLFMFLLSWKWPQKTWKNFD